MYSPMYRSICDMEGHGTWHELVSADKSYQNKKSEGAISSAESEYLSRFNNKSTIAEILNELTKMEQSYCNDYDISEHYNLDYITTVFRKFIWFFKLPYNYLLDTTLSEEYLQVHVYGPIIDTLFSDIESVSVARGEMGSRAVSYRKNMQRQYGMRKSCTVKVDAVVRTRGTSSLELVTMESGRHDSVDGQTKFLSDRYKLAKTLKDQIDYLYTSLPSTHKEKIRDLEVFGILTSGLEGTVYVMNLPYSGVYKFSELFHFMLPKTIDEIGNLTTTILRFLAVKKRVHTVLATLKQTSQTVSQDVLSSRRMWSPVSGKEILTRETPATPTHTPRTPSN